MRGAVDRIDVGANGHLEVTDYKTGKDHPSGGLDTRFEHGTRLQLPIYVAAAEAWSVANGVTPAGPVHARYWFVTERGRFKEVGYPVTTEVLEQLAQVLSAITDGMATGLFPAFPPPPQDRGGYVPCAWCDPDGLGTRDRHREAVAKQGDLFLHPLLVALGRVDDELDEPEDPDA